MCQGLLSLSGTLSNDPRRGWSPLLSEMLAILEHREQDNKAVEQSQNDQPHRDMQDEAIHLVENKNHQEPNRPGVCPELFFEQNDDQNDLHDPPAPVNTLLRTGGPKQKGYARTSTGAWR